MRAVDIARFTCLRTLGGAGARASTAPGAASAVPVPVISTTMGNGAGVSAAAAAPGVASVPVANAAAGPAVAAAPAPGPAPAQAIRVAATPGGWYLQLGAYSQQANAEQARLKLAGNWPDLEVVQSNGMYRLYAGPWASRAQAESALQAQRPAGTPAAIVVQRQAGAQ